MAFEEAGFAEWEGGANEVPTTVVKTQQIRVNSSSQSLGDIPTSLGSRPMYSQAKVSPASLTFV
jgi:hypothetical protein